MPSPPQTNAKWHNQHWKPESNYRIDGPSWVGRSGGRTAAYMEWMDPDGNWYRIVEAQGIHEICRVREEPAYPEAHYA